MSQIATTIEQSKRLIELGLNPESADMYYACRSGIEYHSNIPEIHYLTVGKTFIEDLIPAWSLEALLELMPEINNYLPFLRKYENYYCVMYYGISTRNGDAPWQNGRTPVEAAYNMIIWLLENKYI